MVGDEFEERVQYYKSAWLPARDIVYKAIESRKEVRCKERYFLQGNQPL